MLIRYFFSAITVLTIITGLNSCQKEDLNNIKDRIIGTWVYDAYLIDSDCEVYSAKKELDQDRHGMIFKPKGKLIIRNIDGWCATPPVTFENYDGTWELLNDSTVHISHDWWGNGSGQPQMESTFQIVRLDEEQLWIKYIF